MRNNKVSNIKFKSKKLLQKQKIYNSYKKALTIRKTRFSVERILMIFKWNFDANKLFQFNQKIASETNWDLKMFIESILEIFNLDDEKATEKDVLVNFWSFYFYALSSYYFRKNKNLRFVKSNIYETKDKFECNNIKRAYYLNFLKNFSKVEKYNSKIRLLFTKITYLLGK
ncbi:hypothetical protein [Mycoplasmopsis iners]|uniref:hypothetical protein n=1 Tax=Mycoplasmopsis iners TaxID=76630 RepID=UPI000495CA0E|nr:hypothetical protein [Mycoplasmopsis iners]